MFITRSEIKDEVIKLNGRMWDPSGYQILMFALMQ